MTAIIRVARHRDLAAIVAMLADDELGRGRENPADLDRYNLVFGQIEGDVRNAIMVAEVDGAIAGCFQITFITGLSRNGATRALVEGVRTHAEHRGKGVGEAMMHHAIGMARARGCALVQLTSDKTRTRAHEFYRRLGFKMSHEGFKLDL
ncbi:MAG: GNAT family N-acetyltransferase [Alphaproteobacteria bacterium]|nr:GNAT family N-acetyltransferase [Alphaproteobacteria bacterium]MBL7097443.1 GNAT family N-acetyltransferase [Alphaproteobacteria bacterium]